MNTEWFAASGRGSIYIYSYTINHRGESAYKDASPFVVAYVELEEGPRVLTNIDDADLNSLTIGGRVEVVFTGAGAGTALFRLRPVAT